MYEVKVRRVGERAAKIIDDDWVGWVKKQEERKRIRMEVERRGNSIGGGHEGAREWKEGGKGLVGFRALPVCLLINRVLLV